MANVVGELVVEDELLEVEIEVERLSDDVLVVEVEDELEVDVVVSSVVLEVVSFKELELNVGSPFALVSLAFADVDMVTALDPLSM